MAAAREAQAISMGIGLTLASGAEAEKARRRLLAMLSGNLEDRGRAATEAKFTKTAQQLLSDPSTRRRVEMKARAMRMIREQRKAERSLAHSRPN